MNALLEQAHDLPPPRRLGVGDVALSVYLEGPTDGVPVVLLHGWPELALSWATQIGPLAAAGYRVIAPDLRGFGNSDAPSAIDAYHIDRLVADLAGLLDTLGIERAVIAGHDWGGIILWQAACLMPDRLLGAIGVNTPHLPHGSRPPTAVFRAQGGSEHYIVRFQNERTDHLFSGHEEAFFAFIFSRPPTAAKLAQLPPSLTHIPRRFARFLAHGGHRAESDCVVPAALRARYAAAYRASGFRGGLNLYRNMDANWARMADVNHHLQLPCLMISAECDMMLPPALTRWMPDLCADLESHTLPGIGHWTQYEAPQQLSVLMLDWLQRRFPAAAPAP